MKRYSVTLSNEQARFFENACSEMYTTRPGDLLLALAFDRLDMTEDSIVEASQAALVGFVRHRRLPSIARTRLNPRGIHGLPCAAAA